MSLFFVDLSRKPSHHLTAMSAPSRAWARTSLKGPGARKLLCRLTYASVPVASLILDPRLTPHFQPLAADSQHQYPRTRHLFAAPSGVQAPSLPARIQTAANTSAPLNTRIPHMPRVGIAAPSWTAHGGPDHNPGVAGAVDTRNP